jgi:hypothetical protein
VVDDDEQPAALDPDGGTASGDFVADAACRGAAEGTVAERIAEPGGGDSAHSGGERQERDDVADQRIEREARRAVNEAHVVLLGAQGDGDAAERREREQEDIGKGMIETRAAQGADYLDGRGAVPFGGQQSKLGIGLIFGGGVALEPRAERFGAAPAGGADRVEVADDDVGGAVPTKGSVGTAVGGDDEVSQRELPAPPVVRTSRISVREDDDTHDGDGSSR